MAGGRLRMAGDRLRTAGGRLLMDGPWPSARGWPKGSPSRLAVVVRWVRFRVDRGWPGLDPAWSAARPWSGSSFCRTTDDGDLSFRILHKKMSVRGWGMVGGSARVHECIVGSAQNAVCTG